MSEFNLKYILATLLMNIYQNLISLNFFSKTGFSLSLSRLAQISGKNIEGRS